MSKRVIAIVVVAILFASAGGVLLAKRRAIQRMAPPPEKPIPVRTATVQDGSVADTIVTAAILKAEVTATAAAQTSGAILEMRFREGARVRKGEVLAEVDSRPLEDVVQAAEARLLAARQALQTQEAMFGRDRALFEGGAISQEALDLSRTKLESARASSVAAERSLATAKVRLGYASVTAPYGGVVTARLSEPGDLAAPGRPLYTIQRDGGVKLLSKLSQESLRRIEPGGEADFSWEGESLSSRISRIYPALDASHLGTVETVLGAAPFGLPSGSMVEARYHASPSRGLVVPVDALAEEPRGMLVVKLASGKAEPTPVDVVARDEDDAIVTGALSAGDRLVVGLPSELMALTAGTALAPVTGAGR